MQRNKLALPPLMPLLLKLPLKQPPSSLQQPGSRLLVWESSRAKQGAKQLADTLYLISILKERMFILLGHRRNL